MKMTVAQAATAQVPMITANTHEVKIFIGGKIFATVWVERLPVGCALREDDGADDGGGAGVEEHVGLLVTRVGREQVLEKIFLVKKYLENVKMMSCSHLHELILDPPGLGPHVEPDEDVGECLQEQDRVPQLAFLLYTDTLNNSLRLDSESRARELYPRTPDPN